jgi:hypothetical protein
LFPLDSLSAQLELRTLNSRVALCGKHFRTIAGYSPRAQARSGRNRRSADLQSAVSQICNLRPVRRSQRPPFPASRSTASHCYVVAQICNLPYRRFVICVPHESNSHDGTLTSQLLHERRSAPTTWSPHATDISNTASFAYAQPTASRRYGRLQICATSAA